MDKGTIHHKDGNSINNDPNNWQVLCSVCHGEKHQPFKRKGKDLGYVVMVSFKPWLRKELFEGAGYKCQECGNPVIDYSSNRNNAKLRCQWCKLVVPKDATVKWQNGKIMCRVCFDKWLKSKSPSLA